MNSLHRLLAATALVAVAASGVSAHERNAVLTYTISFPGSSTSDFIDEMSFLGAEVAARMTPSTGSPFLLGMTFGWQVFDFESSEPIDIEGGTISGHQLRYLNALPMLATAHYCIDAGGASRVLVGLGAGTAYVLQQFQLGVFDFDSGNWHFMLAPELAYQHEINPGTALYASGRYNFAFAAGESLNGDGHDWDYWTVNVGFAWTDW